MAKKSGLTKAAVTIGTTIGRAERTAREAIVVAQAAKKDLEKKAGDLARTLKKAKKELDRAIARARG